MKLTEMFFDRADLCVLELILKRELDTIHARPPFTFPFTDHYAAKVHLLLTRFKIALEKDS